MKQKVRNSTELLPESRLITRDHAVENRLPVVIHELVHCVAEDFIAVEEIIKSERHCLGLEFDFVAGDVDVGLIVVASVVLALHVVPCGQRLH